MTKIYLSLLGFFLALLPCKSQTFTDGKVWNFVQRMYEHDDVESAYSVTVCGDTVVNGQLCKKLVEVNQDSPNIRRTFAVFEKDSKIYDVYGANTQLLMDFNLNVGDKFNEVGTVVAVDYIHVDNAQYRRMTIDYEKPKFRSYLVEGIGLSSTKYSSYFQNSFYKVLVSVYENGKCIFKDSDFAKQTTGLFQKLQTEEKSNTTLYDLSGGQVLVPQKGHVYIKDNKKVIQ